MSSYRADDAYEEQVDNDQRRVPEVPYQSPPSRSRAVKGVLADPEVDDDEGEYQEYAVERALQTSGDDACEE